MCAPVAAIYVEGGYSRCLLVRSLRRDRMLTLKCFRMLKVVETVLQMRKDNVGVTSM